MSKTQPIKPERYLPDMSSWTPQQKLSWAQHQEAMLRFDAMTPEEARQFFIEVGVLDEDGQIAACYRPEPG